MSRRRSNEAPPLKGLAPWAGGKRHAAAQILPLIERTPHTRYAEPFVGMGGIFLRRRKRAPSEVINDYCRDVATLFRVVRHHPEALAHELSFAIDGRAELERLCLSNAETLTDVQRAARLFRIQRMNYGGKPFDRSYVARRRLGDRAALLQRFLRLAQQRLVGVQVECLDFETFIGRYDGPGTLFYVDPPYWGTEHYYGRALFQRSDYGRLATCLTGMKGRFILSINDRPEIRELFPGCRLRALSVPHGISGARPVRELLIEGPRR